MARFDYKNVKWNKKALQGVMLVLLLCLILTACGKEIDKDADEVQAKQENEDLTASCTMEDSKYSDGEIPVLYTDDVEADTVFWSDFPQQLIFEQRTHSVLPYKEHIASKSLCVLKEEDGANVYALPDDSGRILRVAM